MPSQTPDFDKALDAILKDLKPHLRACNKCARNFEIFKEDIEFYVKLRVPPPTLCPNCRKQRRMTFYNVTTFYKRKCNALGHSEDIISILPEKIAWKVYDNNFWWSDAWSPMEFGKDYDFSKPFFEQFKKFFLEVPLLHTARDPKSTDSEYTAGGIQHKNCYYVFGGIKSENVMYGNWPLYTKDSVDILVSNVSELCYEIIMSKSNFNCDFICFSDNCIDSRFLYDCRNCSHCFGCINLRNKQYYFFNESLTRDEYEKRMKEINLGSRAILNIWRQKFENTLQYAVYRSVHNQKTMNSSGSFLRECQNCFVSFWVEKGENLRYIDYGLGLKDNMDFTTSGGDSGERSYEVTNAGLYDIKFSVLTRTSSSLEYCINCFNCSNCFGSIGLRNKQFCIFNKQYLQEDYWKKIDEIKLKMLNNGEYGEFFPISMSPYPYNASLAQTEFPLTEEKVREIGGYWYETPVSLEGIDPKSILKGDQIPDDIKDVKNDILQKVFICEVTGKPFILTKSELEFYRKKDLPLPTKHPYQRLIERFKMKTPFRLWKYPCSKCGKEMYTSYAPEKKLKVYCEACYLREVV